MSDTNKDLQPRKGQDSSLDQSPLAQRGLDLARKVVAKTGLVFKFQGHKTRITDIGCSRDGRVASAEVNGTVLCWRLDSPENVLTMKRDGYQVNCAKPTLDGRTIVSVSDHTISIWDAGTGTLEGGIELPERYGGDGMDISPNGRYVAIVGGSATITFENEHRKFTPGDGNLYMLNMISGQISPYRLPFPACSVALSPTDLRVAVGGYDGTIAVYDSDLSNDVQLWSITNTNNYNGVAGLSFTPDAQWVVSVDNHDGIFVWDSYNGKLLGRLPLDQGFYPYKAVLSPDGRKVLLSISGRESTEGEYGIGLVDLDWARPETLGKCVWSAFDDHRNAIDAIAFTPDSKYAVSGDGNGCVCVYRLP